MKILLKNGTIVSGSESSVADLLIEDEKIVKVQENVTDEADQVIDMTGKMLFPGFIDGHTHMGLHVAGTVTADDFTTGTAAAVAGGTTTLVDFGTQYHGESLKEAEKNWFDKAGDGNSCDYGFHMSISEWTPSVKDEVDDMMADGLTTFKLYMTYPDMMLNDGEIYEVMQKLNEVGSFAGVHCENAPVIDALIRANKAAGNLGPAAHPASRPDTMEAEAVHRLMVIAKEAKAPVMVVHTTNAKALNEIKKAREEGVEAYCETCPQYLILDKSSYELPDFEGAKYICAPPLRTKDDQEALWAAIRDGDVDIISTDHCSFTWEQRLMGKDDYTKIPGGLPGVEFRGNLIWSEGVAKGRISAECACRVLAENPAKLFGLYPKKGVLAPGSDADIVVIDPQKEKTITAEGQVTNVDYSVYEGLKLQGCIDQVYLRGNLCVEDSKLIKRGLGQFIKRDKPIMIRRK
ncbi:MAG: dihydropyrimidinase [Lachnospiraceae bacterium]|nr:dihydropyrimidinase [Lachnospiraceae bacterium]